MSAAMNGNYAEAKKSGDMLAAHVGPGVKQMPPLEGFMTIPMAVDVRFHKWGSILATKEPDPSMKITTVFWHFARGMALAGTGKISEAETEYKAVSEAEKGTPEDVPFAMPVNNKAKDIMKIATNVLGAKIAMAKKDTEGAITTLQEAVTVQDSLKYDEPADWFFPVRESLGAALLVKGDAAAAEKVFREDLERNPRNPRSLYGLQQALKKQGRDYDAGFVEKQFKASWKGAVNTLRMEDLI
jgi:tetratricopeptide (TPR) repeat protein